MFPQTHLRRAILALLTASCGFAAQMAQAVPAAPFLHTLKQPSGYAFQARQWGDERLHGFETASGRTLIKDAKSGAWHYAKLNSRGQLVSSGIKVTDNSDIENRIAPHQRPSARLQEEANDASALASLHLTPKMRTANEMREHVVSPVGTGTVPVLMINYNNTTTTNTTSDFNTLLFGTGNGSMKDYYTEVSYGKFTVSAGAGGIGGWYTASNTHDYYGTDVNGRGDDLYPAELVIEAVKAADAANFPFEDYDKDNNCYVDVVSVIHQGTGQEASAKTTDIWSHRWNLASAYYYGYSKSGIYTTSRDCPSGGKIKINDYVIEPERLATGTTTSVIQTMGVFAHEYGHALGLPDLYDIDYTSRGVGSWSIMAAGTWLYTSKPGDRPSHLDAWSKAVLGWVTPTKVSSILTNETISAASGAADVYQLVAGTPGSAGEYFLIENRQKSGFDSALPGAGLLVWHIDEATSSNRYECYPGGPACSSQHYKVAVNQADNLWNLEKNSNNGDTGDVYPGVYNKTSFTASTAPNTNLYRGTATGVSMTTISPSSANMTATLNPGVVVTNLPDFTVTSITRNPVSPMTNTNFSVTVTVKNQGTATGTGGVLGIWTDQATTPACSSTPRSSVTVGSLAAGTSANYVINDLPAGAVGTKTLRAFVDKDCQTSESSESNNQLTASYSVIANSAMDLVVTDMTISRPVIPKASGVFSAIITVKNTGTVATNGAWLDVWADQTTAQSCPGAGDQYAYVPGLAAGASTVLVVNNLPAGAAGSKTLRAFVDSYCDVTEAKEDNNQSTLGYTVQ